MPIILLATALVCQVPRYQVKADSVPKSSIERVERALGNGTKMVTSYFGNSFPTKFEVVVASRRGEFDAVAAKRWKMPPSEKWMVGAGTADLLVILSPDRWKDEAVEHDGFSDKELGEIVTHELVHVYHAQVCPNHDFDGMDDMGWFVEGLAVVVSGQLQSSNQATAAQALKDGRGPDSLTDGWTGKYRYGVSGSMVKYVEVTWGKKNILELMKVTSNRAALQVLHLTETQFLAKWRSWVVKKEQF